MEPAFESFTERRRDAMRVTKVHIEADPNKDGVREIAEQICDVVRDEEAPALEGVGSILDAPEGAAILIEKQGPQWRMDDEWEEIRKRSAVSRVKLHHEVIVAEDIDPPVEEMIDVRVRITDDGPEWYRIQVNPYDPQAGVHEVPLDETRGD